MTLIIPGFSIPCAFRSPRGPLYRDFNVGSEFIVCCDCSNRRLEHSFTLERVVLFCGTLVSQVKVCSKKCIAHVLL